MHGFKPESSDRNSTSFNKFNSYKDKVRDQHENGFDIRDPFAARLMQTQNVQEARQMLIESRKEVIKDAREQVKQKKKDIEALSRYGDQMSEHRRDRLEDRIMEPIQVKDPTSKIEDHQRGIANMTKKYKPHGF